MADVAKSGGPARGAQRRTTLGGNDNTAAGGTRVDVLPSCARLSLRAPGDSVATLSAALRIDLPTRPATSTIKGSRAALWLGPDEWFVLDEEGTDPGAALADVGVLHSAVDISHRNVAMTVSGPGAEATLNAGCPRDLGLLRFPVGACSRTIFGKAEIVLWRTDDHVFRVECWRSFAGYVQGLLLNGAADASA